MIFEESVDHKGSSKHILILEHNYPVKSSRPNKELTYAEKEKLKLMIGFKDMKNSDYKNKGLWFRLVVVHGTRKIACERRFKDFEYLRLALSKAFPGCFVPKIVINDLAQISSQLSLGTEIPQSYLEKKREFLYCRAIESFCDKLEGCPYLIESGKDY